MTAELLQQLRAELEQATGLTEEAKNRLLGHIEALEQYEDDQAKAESGLKHLSSSIEELEASHPAITTLIGRVAVALSNMGI